MLLLSWINEPWHWAVSGAMISFVMFLLLLMGRSFGVSATLRAMCTMGGAGKKISFFDFDWKTQRWNLTFILGAVIGGFIASQYMQPEEAMQLAPDTVAHLTKLGVDVPKDEYRFLPNALFDTEQLTSLSGLLLLIVGGFLVGFGARYAGGCTSGHAISGLSNLQLPSLIAVIGFFIGGLLMTYLFMPMLFGQDFAMVIDNLKLAFK